MREAVSNSWFESNVAMGLRRFADVESIWGDMNPPPRTYPLFEYGEGADPILWHIEQDSPTLDQFAALMRILSEYYSQTPPLEHGNFVVEDFQSASHYTGVIKQTPQHVAYGEWAVAMARLAFCHMHDGYALDAMFQTIADYRFALHKIHTGLSNELKMNELPGDLYVPGRRLIGRGKSFLIELNGSYQDSFGDAERFLNGETSRAITCKLPLVRPAHALRRGSSQEYPLGLVERISETAIQVTHDRTNQPKEIEMYYWHSMADFRLKSCRAPGIHGAKIDIARSLMGHLYLGTNLHLLESGGDASHRSAMTGVASYLLEKRSPIKKGVDLRLMLARDQYAVIDELAEEILQ